MKIVVALIDSQIRGSRVIKTRFLLFENDFKDITYDLCEGINKTCMHKFKYEHGLAVYSSDKGILNGLKPSVLNRVRNLDLRDSELEVFNLTDIRFILNCKNAFDINLTESLREYFKKKNKI
ncbi:hypothetical protein BFS06_11695 [Clostridium perfringens]|uniref:Uncharacterized protein n=1 Tax=Clostridium perfringens TaxID=1502 RepID=A0A140GS48_CLOPF|nr:hypothetical protein [Clostridium perfringens]AMN31357.1 hypothetical protein JFP838_pA0441 [Clostridium perfringens]TBX14876.1 hypothetical protein BFS06_11695 [Clostridium perfringens]